MYVIWLGLDKMFSPYWSKLRFYLHWGSHFWHFWGGGIMCVLFKGPIQTDIFYTVWVLLGTLECSYNCKNVLHLQYILVYTCGRSTTLQCIMYILYFSVHLYWQCTLYSTNTVILVYTSTDSLHVQDNTICWNIIHTNF